jgi:replication factor C small subunit
MIEDLWVEELRPKKLDEIIALPGGNNHLVIKILKGYIEKKKIPHLLFSGAPGSAKTTTALCIAEEIYGSSKSHFVEINSSEERGIDVVRNKIKQTAMAASDKIIFLEECDALTNDSQNALRSTIEKFANKTRFILSCNYRYKIIPPIQSRMTCFHFAPLSNAEMNLIVDNVCAKKGIIVSPEIRDILFRYAKGDARRVINPLQSASMLGTTISKEAIQVFTQTPDLDTARLIVNTAVSGDFISAHEMLVTQLINKGFDYEFICESILEAVKTSKFTDDKNRNNRIIATINAIVANHSHYMGSSSPIIEFSGILSKITMIDSIQSVGQVL